MQTIKNYIKKELKEHETIIEAKGGISSTSLERIHLLTDTYKNICKIEKYDCHYYEDMPEHKNRNYSSAEVREIMEKLYGETDHAGDKAAILKAMKEL